MLIINFRVKAAFSATSVAKVGRMQPIRLFASNKPANNHNGCTQSESVSSFSSSASETSLTQYKPIESEPIPSTSSGKYGCKIYFKEVELQPMVESSKHVSFMKSVDLHEASAGTHSGGNINPAQDGVILGVIASGYHAKLHWPSIQKRGWELLTRDPTVHFSLSTKRRSTKKKFDRFF